jgi:hypothetical protein
MSLQDELTRAMVDGYRRAGEEVGNWGKRYLQAIRRGGGLTTAKRMLRPRTQGQRQGLDALLEEGRPDLTTEAIVLEPRRHEVHDLGGSLFLNGANKSIGTGRNVVVLCSLEISRIVCRKRSCSAIGSLLIIAAACTIFSAA